MNVNSAKIISFLMLVTLPFGNVTKLIGIEDGFSVLTILMMMFFLVVNFTQNFKINFFLNPFGVVFILLILATLINLLFKNIQLFDALSNIFKISTVILLFDFIKKNDFVFNYFLSNYYKVYLFSLFISLPLYFIFPYEEFVFYDGSENRFAGLHFELFNFMFSTSLFLISWVYNGKNIKIGLFTAFLLMYFAKSNIFYLFLFAFLFAYIFKRFFDNKNFTYLSVLTIIFSPVIIGFFLELLDFLNLFALRSVSSFSHQGSSIYTRLYPFTLAVQQLIESGWKSLLPMGIGYFENTSIVVNDPFSYNGTGSPKAMVDLGIILFMILYFYISKSFYVIIRRTKYLKKDLVINLMFSVLIFLSFGAGFFNIVGWFCIISINNDLINNKLSLSLNK